MRLATLAQRKPLFYLRNKSHHFQPLLIPFRFLTRFCLFIAKNSPILQFIDQNRQFLRPCNPNPRKPQISNYYVFITLLPKQKPHFSPFSLFSPFSFDSAYLSHKTATILPFCNPRKLLKRPCPENPQIAQCCAFAILTHPKIGQNSQNSRLCSPYPSKKPKIAKVLQPSPNEKPPCYKAKATILRLPNPPSPPCKTEIQLPPCKYAGD